MRAGKARSSEAETWRPSPLIRIIDTVEATTTMPSYVAHVAIAIARRFNPGGFAWMTITDIKKRTRLSWHTVWRALKYLRTMSPQIIEMRRRPNVARDRRGCYEFQLVFDPEAFTAARDVARANRFTPDDLLHRWNAAARQHDLPQCRLTHQRRAIAANAIAENPAPNYWEAAIERMVNSNFVHGVTFTSERDGPSSPKGFDFLLRFHVEIHEGKYDD
jgi:hypothetical protein